MSAYAPSAPSPIESMAQRLPNLALTRIFECCLEPEVTTDEEDNFGLYVPEHGGDHIRWDSNEDILPFFSVCRNWSVALEGVLYASIRVVGECAANGFLRTVARRPALGHLVRRLVVGLERGGNGEDASTNNGQATVSGKLVEVIAACPQIQALHLRPLHDSVGERTTVLLATRPSLRTLVIGPRLKHAVESWTCEMFTASTLPVSLPWIRNLEIDGWVRDVPLQLPLPEFAPLELQHFCLQDVSIPDEVFAAVVGHAAKLEFLEVYSEHIFDVAVVQPALMACVGSLRVVVFIANPGVDELRRFTHTGIAPLMDSLLPHCTNLEHLYVSASEISINLFTIVPPSLRTIKIQAFNHLATFYYSGRLIEHLEDRTMPLHVTDFEIHDAASSWEQGQIEVLEAACLARGIRFIFTPDDAEEEEA